jgi:hypothetical protein
MHPLFILSIKHKANQEPQRKKKNAVIPEISFWYI